MVRSQKELGMLLSNLRGFSRPKRRLEQYPTDPATASSLLWHAYMRGDIEGKNVVDLGCGTGLLTLGALLLGAKYVVCVDIDVDALIDAKSNLSSYSESVDLLLADAKFLNLRGVDTVVMNPPFGVVKKGIDLAFLEASMELARSAIYTIHKFNYESHRIIVERAIARGFQVSLLEIRNMFIPALYETHRKKTHRFRVALYALRRG